MGDLNDFQRFGRRLQRELDHLDDYPEADQPHVKRFVTRLDKDVSEGTLALYLQNLRMTGERLETPIVELTEAELDEHVYDLRHSPEYGQGGGGMSDDTVRNIQFIVRRYLTEIHDPDGDGDHWASDYELMSPSESSVTPEEMLTPDDIAALTDSANNLRDIALIEFLADTGARISLVMSLRVGDVDLEGETPTYTPNREAKGLKGADIKALPIIDSKGVLRTYLAQVHPRPDQEDVALFHKMAGHGNDFSDDAGALTPNTVRQQLTAAADKAGLDKPANPHNFRHSAVTRMAREGYNRSQIEHRVHWDIDTDMWAAYQHIAGQEHNRDIFTQAGILEDDGSGPSQARSKCGNCLETLAPHHHYCPRCGDAVTQEARNLRDAAQDSAVDTASDIDNPEDITTMAGLVQFVRDNPDWLDHDRSSAD